MNEIIDKAEEDILGLNKLYEESGLPDSVDMEFAKDLILEVRKEAKEPILDF